MQNKNKKRVNLYIDGNFCCGLETITVLKHNLIEGQIVDLDYLSQLQLESEKNTAFDKAIRYISIRMRSQLEIENYLKDKGYLQATIDYCIEKLLDYKYINDESFAKNYIASKGYKNGKRKLEYELHNFGIDKDIIDNCLDNLDSHKSLLDLIEKKYRGDKQKIIEYCLGRGFVFSEIRQALDVFLEGVESDMNVE
ncbi:MAG: recombination regulator RecX [Firmicutes bacterium]|nr:recombination regulator RecX [Bacillota bacterium]